MTTPRFAAYVPFPATTLTLNTESAGDQTATLPAGVYAWFGIAPTKTGVTAASATVNVDSGSQFNAGDLVDVYDVSADAFLVQGAVVQSVTASTVVIDQSVTTAAGDVLYLSGDLCGTLEALLAATDVANDSSSFRVRPYTDATLADVYYQGGFTGVLTLDAYTADVLRLSTSVSVGDASGGDTSERSVLGSFAPSKTILEDLPRKRRIGNTYVSDNGTFRRITIAQQVRHLLEVSYRGGPRATDWSEIHAWEAFLELVDQGYKFRLYRDTTTTTAAYAQKTNPYGWQEWHVENGGAFEPANPRGGIYDNWVHRLDLIEAT